MIEMYAVIAIALIAGGIALGIVVCTSLGIRTVTRGLHTTDTLGRFAGAAQTITGLGVRRPDVPYQANPTGY